MFCEKCGQNNADGAMFCESCGAPLGASEVQPESSGDFYSPSGSSDTEGMIKKIVPIAIPVVAIVVVLLILNAFGLFRPGYEKALHKNTKSIITGDGKAYYETSVDKYYLENMLDSEYSNYDDADDVIDEYTDNLEERKEYFEDEEDLGELKKYKLEIKKKWKYDKDEVEDISEYLEDECDYPEGALDDIVVVKAKRTIIGKDDDTSDTIEYVITKIDGKWYVDGYIYSREQIKSILKGDWKDSDSSDSDSSDSDY